MALRGNLKDFSLPDVFQLVTLSRKTGILRIKRADSAEGSVWFRDGDVFFAQSNWHREPLGERLVSAGKVTPSALARVLDVQKTEGSAGRRLGQILVDEGYITDKVLEAFVQEQIQDTIFDLFRWDEGDFDFDPLEGVPDEDIGLSVSIENIVMEGSRRLEEWNRIKKKIPSMEIVFKMATAPGEGTFEISLKPVEWNLLLLVDGTRSVSDLASETSRTDFEVARVLYGLFSAGLLEVASDEEVEKLRVERGRLETRAAEMRGSVAPPAPKKEAAEPVPAPAAPAAPAPPVEEREHEVPTFLTQQAEETPSAEDMAVFEQMMGAVLQTPPAPVEAQPAMEPAEAPSVEIRVETPRPPEPEPAMSDFFSAQNEEIPLPPVEEAPAPPEELQPEIAEPMSVIGAPTTESTPETASAETTPEPGPGFEPSHGQTIAELEAAALAAAGQESDVAVVGAVEDVAVEIVPEPLEDGDVEQASWLGEEAPGDLTDLLSSLREESEEPPGAPEADAPARIIGTDEEEPTEVISTDAFLSDFDDMSGSAFSGGLGDELTALTGGGRAAPRHNVVSSSPPAAEQHALQRDQLVDKDLVMKVIEGIKNL
ncbi:MAG TPA: DUF4388 domain-containing protein [Coriobacteriia bacterium]|jgi:hypothetical protein